MKKHNSILTVDLNAISSNVKVLQSYLNPGVGQMAVVKADAYGHGAIKVAQKIESQVSWLAVNDVYEGIELRNGGIDIPILIFCVPESETAPLYRQYDLTATVSALPHFRCLLEGTEYHLHFNTGMNRLGFRMEQLEEVISEMEKYPEPRCTGIYSHLANADEPESSKSEQQNRAFKEIRSRFDSTLLTHISNTAGIVRNKDTHFDIVRTGIGIYGYAPGKISIPELKPALNWQTRLAQVNPIKQGETVSYGATWKAEEDGYIGIIPVGYCDGIPRGLSGNFKVTIDDNLYSVAGTVTMNYCMIWLGKQKLEVGTSVELINEHHTAQNWANVMQTIPYEILTAISHSFPRKYIDDTSDYS